MKLRKSKLTATEIVALYSAKNSIKHIQEMAGISRPAVYAILNSVGVELGRREILTLKCRFCKETYEKPRSHVKGDNSGYCSIQCFHADRSLSGEYSKVGGVLTRIQADVGCGSKVTNRQLGRKAVKVIESSGIVLKRGEVVHHKDGDRRNFDIGNLQVFPSQSAHMKYHHSLRASRP